MRKALSIFALVLACHSIAAAELAMQPAATSTATRPSTTNNDDSCDIATLPAATLLLPYFHVDVDEPQASGQTTLFTITNVTQRPQIARVTIWSDWAFPVLTFNIFLTGYDVQSINLYDVLVGGVIAPGGAATIGTAPGRRSLPSTDNPNFSPLAASTCASLPGAIPASVLADVTTALTRGQLASCGRTRIGGHHPASARGYATIDVVADCNSTLPTDANYYTSEILFDNALTGDYMQVDSSADRGNYAGISPLVHIRAIPEGGPAGVVTATHLPYTFYDRLTPASSHRIDRRQPLPSAFAARFVAQGFAGANTELMIWREAITNSIAACDAYAQNSAMVAAESVRFDEHENPTFMVGGVIILAPDPTIRLPATTRVSTQSGSFPPLSPFAGDTGGWLYVNANNGGSTAYSASRPGFGSVGSASVEHARQSQNWITVLMTAEGRYGGTFDATALGNGCSPAPALTTQAQPLVPAAAIGPAANVNP